MEKKEEAAQAATSGFDLSEAFGTSEVAEVDGVWCSLDADDAAALKVARLGNPEAQRAYRKIPREMRRRIEDGTLGNEQSIAFLADFLSRNILRDWRGLALAGKDLPKYTLEEGARQLKHKVHGRRFRDKVWELASDEDRFNVGESVDRKN